MRNRHSFHRPLASLTLIVWSVLLTGCAVGNNYNYRLGPVPLPVDGNGNIGLVVTDRRPYVMNGDKDPNFVGLQRGGFGNPFNVTTSSGDSLVDDMAKTLEESLDAKGYSIARIEVESTQPLELARMARINNLQRMVLFEVRDWKSDAYMNITLHYDLLLLIFDDQGNELARNAMAEVEKVSGAGLEGQNSQTLGSVFERKVGFLFNPPEIRSALDI